MVFSMTDRLTLSQLKEMVRERMKIGESEAKRSKRESNRAYWLGARDEDSIILDLIERVGE